MIVNPHQSIISKLPGFGTSVFARMTALATEYNAVNLAQGFPDFNAPEDLVNYLFEGAKQGYNQYAPMPGILKLREQIAERLFRDYEFQANPDTEITVTAGATQAIYTIISSLIKYGDKVLIFEPAYDSYAPSVLVNGGIPVYLRLKENNFEIPLDEFEQLIQNEDIKLMIINNPHNPAGTILKREDILKISKIVEDKDIYIIWDEVYDLLIYDQQIHESALKFPALLEKSIIVFSMGKTLHNTGWKVGYFVANESLTMEIRKLHQFTVFSVNTPAQFAIASFMEKNSSFFLGLSNFYEQKRNTFLEMVKSAGLNFLDCKGSYFALASYKQLSDKSDEEVAKELVSKCGIACVPISAFYHDHYDPKILRFCFAKKQETLELASIRLSQLHEHHIFSK